MSNYSIIISAFIKVFNMIVSLIEKSAAWRFLSGYNKKFNKSVETSAIVYACSSFDQLDKCYSNRVNGIESFISKISYKIFSPLRNALDRSSIVSYLNYACEDVFNIPLVFPGIALLILGVIALVGTFFTGAGAVASLLCAFFFAFGVILTILKHSVLTICKNSLILSWLFTKLNIVLDDSQVLRNTYSYKFFVIVGCILGILMVVFGVIPVTLAVMLVVITAIFLRYTTFTAWIYVCVLPFMPTMAMVFLGLSIFACVVVKSCLGYKDNIFSDKYSFNMLLLFMGISFVIAAAFSFARTSSIKIALVYVAFLCSGYALIKLFSTKKVLYSVLSGISIFSIPVSLFGIYQHFTGFDKQNTWIDTEMFEDISGRVVSFFENPNVFGEYLILVIITSMVCFFISKNLCIKTVHLAAVVLSCVSLVFTYSRGCWIGLIFAVAIFLFISKRRIFAVFCVLGLVSVFFLPDSIISRIASVGNLADSSTSYRVYIWEGTIKMLKDFWITGIGLGSDAFNAVYPLYAYSAITAPHPHNLYLLILTETGVIGAISFFLIVIFYYKRLFAVVRNSNDQVLKIIASGLVAAMSGFLLQGMFDNVWYNYRVFLMFWIYTAMGAVVDIVSRRVYNGKN